MEITGPTEVQLTRTEAFAKKTAFDALLNRGATVLDAARRTEELFPGLDSRFYAWLRDEDETVAQQIAQDTCATHHVFLCAHCFEV